MFNYFTVLEIENPISMGWLGFYLVRELEHGIVSRHEGGISTGQEV